MSKLRQGTTPIKISKNEYPSFSDRLKLAMTLRECSVEELAASSYLTKSTICGYRSGSRSPSIEILRILAENLDVSADFLIGMQDTIFV